MAHNVEPMDIDSSVCDFDNKENSFHHNVLPRTPCTEKGYEELDVSELNMKLRYSITPAASPMSKSYTAYSLDNRNNEQDISTLDFENGNMTRSLHTTFTKNDTTLKSQKGLPLQVVSTDHGQVLENSRHALRPLDSTVTVDSNNVTVTVSGPNDIDETISLPSSASSMAHTPEATTPTKEMPKGDGASPIMRGLKSVLSMFRPSQSPIPPTENEMMAEKPEVLSPPIIHSPETSDRSHVVSASTPLLSHKNKDSFAKTNTPNRDGLVFNDDLEKELEWKGDNTIIFSSEKIPIQKLLFQPKSKSKLTQDTTLTLQDKKAYGNLNAIVEYMDISYNDSNVMDKSASKVTSDMNKSEIMATESDGEFVDCESTFTKNESQSEQSFLSHVDDELISAKVAYIDAGGLNAVERKSLNASTETLNANHCKSADLSIASTDTTRPIDNISESEVISTSQSEANFQPLPDIAQKTEESSPKEMKTAENPESSQDVPEAEVTINQNTNVVKDNSSPNILAELASFIINHENRNVGNNDVNNTSNVENIGVKSLSQIPLIVDPRVLLFNIPSAPVVDDNDEKSVDVDVLNTSPADIPLPDDDDIEKMSSLSLVNAVTENTQMIEHKTNEILDVNQQFNINQVIEEPTILIPSEDKEEKPQDTLLFDVDNVSKIKEIVLPAADFIQANVKQEPIAENIQLFEGIDSLNVPELISIPDIEKTLKDNEISIQNIEPMDVNITQNNIIPEFDQKELCNEDVVRVDSYIPEVGVIPVDIKVKTDENVSVLKSIDAQGNGPDLLRDITPISSTLTATEPEEVNAEMPISTAKIADTSDIENIKQIVEEIVTNAIDMVTEKAIATIGDIVSDFSEHLPTETVDSKIGVMNIAKDLPTVDNMNASDTLGEVNLVHEKVCEDTKQMEATDLSNVNHFTTQNVIQEIKTDEKLVDNLKNIVIPVENVLAILNISDVKELVIGTQEVRTENEVPTGLIAEEGKTVNIPEVTLIEDAVIVSTNVPDVTSTPTSNDQIEIAQISTKSEDVIVTNVSESLTASALFQQSEVIPIVATPQKRKQNEMLDEEIVISENNSPFVLVSDLTSEGKQENFEEIENPFVSSNKNSVTPPASPKIVSKGYNFNFDVIEDPFATKTKIRQSPPTDGSPNHSFEQIDMDKEFPRRDINKNNRRKSQPERKKLVPNKKNNSTVASKPTIDIKTVSKPDVLPASVVEKDATIVKSEIKKEVPEVVEVSEHPEIVTEGTELNNINICKETVLDINIDVGESLKKENNKPLMDSSVVMLKEISSSEQSAYYSAAASSNESVEIKKAIKISDIEDPNINPFVTQSKICQSPLPEDVNFNPFATKSNIRQSPPPILDIDDPFATKSKIRKSPEPEINANQNTETINNTTVNIEPSNEIPTIVDEPKHEEKDSSGNISDITCSSKTDKDATVQEVHTEDEDTVEGPFLEAEDLNNDEKMSDFDDNVDMMQFSELPPENVDHTEAGEMFIDAEAFEFLLNQNKYNSVADSGKESLFLKFDPLFAKRMSSDGVLSALKTVQKRQSTPKKTKSLQRDETFDKSPVAGPSTLNITQNINNTQDIEINNSTEDSCDDLNITVAKPMMVVNPAVNPIVTPRNKTITPVRSNRQSLTFTSPAIAVIDRLLSMSANNSLIHDTTVAEVRDTEADLALTQLRELLADKEISVYNLRTETKELREKLDNLETQIKSLEAISEERLKKINELNEKLTEKIKLNKSMAHVVEEYERTIASLIAESEQDKKRHAEERMQLIKERDEQTAHLASMEVSFSDLHSKYEKSKQVILGFKANEDICKKSIKEFEENLAKMQNNYELLKQHATSKLNHANEELQKINKAHEAEVLKLNAMIKRKELHITSLEETLQQKTKANEELTAICDELINKVG